MTSHTARLILHAPNVHQGGGLVLLRAMLEKSVLPLRLAFIDRRIQGALYVEAKVQYVRRSVLSRMWAEWQLWRMSRPEDTILCFHGLPPLLPPKGSVIVFIQNRLLIETSSLTHYSVAARLRIRVERLWCRALQRHCTRYIVQTPSMAEAVRRWQTQATPVLISPFVAEDFSLPSTMQNTSPVVFNVSKSFDFLYVASGDPHKNHLVLLKAWQFLAESGVRPSLALTLNQQIHPELCAQVLQATNDHGLAITNIGTLSRDDLLSLYRTSGALIYPSTVESLGLPLIEAAQQGLPILASERDYVRDVVTPTETFDPASPVSIARAVRRFLGQPSPPIPMGTATDFLTDVLS